VLAGGTLSPRRQLLAANLGQSPREILADHALFNCLTCALCSERCPAGVDYIWLVMQLREYAHLEHYEPECPHGAALQSLMRLMARGGMRQNRLEWLTPDLKTVRRQGDTFYWTGCTMYYDALFPDYGTDMLAATRAGVRLLNRLGVVPVVSPHERCCGHDLLWNGDRKNFERLARHNVKLVEESGADTLITPCAECLRTWQIDYAPFFARRTPRLLHLSQVLAERMGELKLKHDGEFVVTYQDPCRLGRHLGIYDAPRQVLASLPDVRLVEMAHSGRRSICCAGASWSNCDHYAKLIQIDRLREARETGAEYLITACPKCQLHFACAMRDPGLRSGIEIPMRDLGTLVAEALAE